MVQLTVITAIILGFVQGATEFLPVSSSGHLVLAQNMLNVELEGSGLLALDVCLHFGTLIAIVAALWNDILFILKSLFVSAGGAERSGMNLTTGEARKVAFMVVVGTVPAVIAVVLFKEFFEGLVSNAVSAAAMLIVTGLILFFTRFARAKYRGAKSLTVGRVIFIGIAQAFAIIPGISRSGSTISMGMYLGLEKEIAARFSFLLAVPAIAGAMVLSVGDLAALSAGLIVSVVIGTVVSAVVGFLCIKWLLLLIKRGNFSVFAYYCWAVGLMALAYKLIF